MCGRHNESEKGDLMNSVLSGTIMAREAARRLLAGLALAVPAMLLAQPVAAHDEAAGSVPAIVVESANSASLPDLVEKLRSERLVYVGETHTALSDHMLQLDVLRGMAAQPGELVLGVEWFQARFQPALDDYIAGRIGEAEMLRLTEYYDRWRFDYRLYRPIMQFARDNAIPVIALNASRELTSAIGKLGINDLPATLRQQLPDSYDVSDKAYEAILRDVFVAHGRDEDGAFQRFVEVQLTWDESMAQRAAEFLNGHADGRILILAGNGHIGGRSGIPNRVTRRTGIRGVTVATYNPTIRNFDNSDYFVLTPQQQLPPAGLMRVMLDTKDEGVFIRGFTPNSPAKKAGVKKGDRLLTINGMPIRYFTDVKIAMMDQPPGSEVEITLQRDGLFAGERTLSMRVALVGDS